MAELKYRPVPHNQKTFLAKARARKGFSRAYNALVLEYQVAGQMLKARSRAGLTQDAVAERMGTTKSAISRLESGGQARSFARNAQTLCERCGVRASSQAGADEGSVPPNPSFELTVEDNLRGHSDFLDS